MRKSTVLLLSALVGLTGNIRAIGANQSGPNQGGITKTVQQAAIDGDVEQIKLHIAKGADFNKADQYGYTPLKRAIEGHHPEAAIAIIESGKADLNAKDREGRTPLIVAASMGEAAIAEALIAKGADVKAKDSYDRTALHAAIQLGQKDLASLLIEKGVDVNGTDKTGQTPLTLAMQRNQPEIADLLRKKGAKEPVTRDSLYGDYAMAGNQGGPQSPGAAPAAPARAAVEVDPNAIRAELKSFEGLAEALKAVDDKAEPEVQGWAQRRSDNRMLLLSGSERQLQDELAFLKPIAAADKAAKTAKAIDELTAKRKKRTDAINGQLREQRRTSMATGRDSGQMGTGRSSMRGGRVRAGGSGYSQTAGPYGGPGARTPQRRPAIADANQPVLDQETQSLAQAWLNAKPEDKKSLLEAVHQMNVLDLDDLRQVATEEQAKKTAAAVSGLMMIHAERVQKITKKWQEDEARQQKLQERYGPGGMPTGRGGMQGTQQQMQQGTRGGRRGR
ncbi:MAG: ankyrin repeat domain-containing protein [Planctomycetes bacterium]|nr:ankyrin repeat domain-containing protein [Planctomycetota bacterium]